MPTLGTCFKKHNWLNHFNRTRLLSLVKCRHSDKKMFRGLRMGNLMLNVFKKNQIKKHFLLKGIFFHSKNPVNAHGRAMAELIEYAILNMDADHRLTLDKCREIGEILYIRDK
jgi:hypothetical protein